MNLPETPSRRQTILDAAWKVFAAYGFRRTSMQDIADAVGISRPALYLDFTNKKEIFRGLATGLFARNISNVELVFAENRPFNDKLLEVLNISFAEFYRVLEETPHGEELLSVKTEFAADIHIKWLADIKLAIEAGLASHVARENIDIKKTGLSVKQLSAIIVNSMNGLKTGQADEQVLRSGAKDIVSLVKAVLQPQ